MSKRARTGSSSLASVEVAKKAGLLPFETLEGKKWVMKALNPADVTTAAVGIPSEDVHNIAVLNWQNDYDISAPPSVSATIPAFDVDVFLSQNPLLYGASISSPSGTMDLSKVGQLSMRYAGTDTNIDGTVTLEPSTAPATSVGLRLVRQIVNTQLDPSQFGGSNSIASRRVFYSQVAQKSRITYGSATIIPTCSELNNGGAISACQQVCQPRKTVLGANNTIMLNTYSNSDFPDSSDALQNPQMYYSRFYDGLYAPYKLRNFNSPQYIPSETQVTSRAPYVVTGASAIGVTAYTSGTAYTLTEVPMNLVPSQTSTSFVLTTNYAGSTKFYCKGANKPIVTSIRFYIATLNGQRGYIDMSLMSPAAGNSQIFYTNDTLLTPVALAVSAHMDEGVIGNGTDVDNITLATSAGTMVFPEAVTMFATQGTDELNNPLGLWFTSQDVTPAAQAAIPGITTPTIPDNLGTTMLSIHMTGVSSTAPVKLIIRFGVEFQLVANTVYSPMKFISPKYDESAMKTYGRAIRAMRDGFFANAGVPAGQPDFLQRLRTLVEYDQVDSLERIMNQGGSFQGSIGG